MPTYTFKCPVCGLVRDVAVSIAKYSEPDFTPPRCHDTAGIRFFTAPDPARALDALTSDAIYDGLKAPDGSDISTRSKHRDYMKRNGLTTVDDFTQTWAQAARERADYFEGKDPSRVRDVVQAWERNRG